MKFNIKFKKSWKHWLVFASVFVVVLVLDMLSKYFFEGDSFVLINKFFGVESTHNYGAGWSVLNGKTGVLIAMAIIFIAVFVSSFFYVDNQNFLYFTSMGFILSGAIGNLGDRIAFGYVRDFCRFLFIDFPIFNIADVALTIGVILFIIYFIVNEVKKGKSKNDKKNNS